MVGGRLIAEGPDEVDHGVRPGDLTSLGADEPEPIGQRRAGGRALACLVGLVDHLLVGFDQLVELEHAHPGLVDVVDGPEDPPPLLMGC